MVFESSLSQQIKNKDIQKKIAGLEQEEIKSYLGNR